MEASETVAAASPSRATATGWPWKFPPESTSPLSGITTGLSETDPISIAITRRAKSNMSR
jgi:hypothetical protein